MKPSLRHSPPKDHTTINRDAGSITSPTVYNAPVNLTCLSPILGIAAGPVQEGRLWALSLMSLLFYPTFLLLLKTFMFIVEFMIWMSLIVPCTPLY